MQSWVDGSAGNHGIVISHQTTSNGVDMDSSETAGAMNRPRLEVTYSFSTTPNQAPEALFSYSCTGLWCSFTDTSTDVDGTVVSWSWGFDDGITSGVQNPLHQFAGDGTYAVSLEVTDNDGAVDFYNLNVTVSATTTSSAIDIPVSSGSDDVEEKLSDGSMYMNSSDIELGDDLASNGEQTVGLRFNNIGIPHAATITSGYISFTGDEASPDATSVRFYAEGTDNATPFSTSDYDLTNRIKTTAFVNWSSIPAWVVNGIYPSPDLSTLVQEVVDRPGWVVNNSMAFVIPGTGRRTAEAYEGEPGSAAMLHVEFEGGSCSARRTLVADRWETFALPCDPGVNNQVQQVLSALTATGAYDVSWVVWRYNEGAGTYTQLAADDALLPGHGYWLYTLNTVTVNFVGEFNNLSGRALSTDPVNGSLSFVGNYRNEAVSWPEVVVLNGGSEVDIAGADPINNAPPPVMFECDMSPAGDDCLVSRKAYWWSGSNYDTFSTQVPGFEGEIPVGHAVFVKAFAPGSSLRLPTGLGASSLSEQASQASQKSRIDRQTIEVQQVSQSSKATSASGKTQKKGQPSKSFEQWLLRLIVSSADKQDRGNVLGRLPDSETGADLNDVEELAPFGGKYLSLTFDSPQLPAVNWGYTSDFRAPAKHAKGEWPILVRASSDVGEITLNWEVIEGSSKKVSIRDEQTGLEHRLKTGSDYRFPNADGVNRFNIIVR